MSVCWSWCNCHAVQDDLPPHVYSVADAAYRAMMDAPLEGGGGTNQSMLVSGESGAGKTETTKIIMQCVPCCLWRIACAGVWAPVPPRIESCRVPCHTRYLATVGRAQGRSRTAVSGTRLGRRSSITTGDAMANPAEPEAAGGGGAGAGAQRSSVEDRVLQSNPILEAFGNAKTLRNDNSSRFGKFIELGFSLRGHLIGATVQT